MKKLLAVSAIGLLLVVFTFACGRNNSPTSATSSTIIKAKDDSSPITIITNVSMSVTVANGLTIANCNDNSINNNLYCGPYIPNSDTFPVPLTLSIPPDGSLVDGALYLAGEDLASVQINGTPVHVLQPGNHACGAVLWSGTEFGQIVESYDFGAVLSLFNKKGPSTINLAFSTTGCFAYGLFYTFSQPVTTIITPTPGAPTNTFTPVPTNTFTPIPTCIGANCADAAPEQRQCLPSYAITPLAGGNTAIPEASFCNAGCFLTCLAMADRSTPPTLNNLFTQAGDFNTTGGLIAETAAQTLGWEESDLYTFTDEQIISAICLKQHVIVQVSHPKIHYVLVTGRTTDSNGKCHITINDPGDQSKKYLDDPSYTSLNKVMMFDTTPLGS